MVSKNKNNLSFESEFCMKLIERSDYLDRLKRLRSTPDIKNYWYASGGEI